MMGRTVGLSRLVWPNVKLGLRAQRSWLASFSLGFLFGGCACWCALHTRFRTGTGGGELDAQGQLVRGNRKLTWRFDSIQSSSTYPSTTLVRGGRMGITSGGYSDSAEYKWGDLMRWPMIFVSSSRGCQSQSTVQSPDNRKVRLPFELSLSNCFTSRLPGPVGLWECWAVSGGWWERWVG